MKMKFKAILPVLVLMLGAFLFPVTAHAQVSDTTPPTITATLSGDILTATAKDEGSGVAAIFVGKHEFSTLADGVAIIPFKEYAGTTEQKVEVYAVDVAGNRSESVQITNLWYVAPVSSTPAPTPTPTPVPAPTPTIPSAPAATPAPTSSSSPASSTPLPEPQPPASEPTDSAIPGAANPLTPNGGGTVQDNATGEDGKEFFTVTTAAGNVYYLVVDRQRGTENVYFLSPVTEDDLLGLAQSDAPAQSEPPQPEPPADSSAPGSEPQAEAPAPSGGVNTGAIIFILLAVAAVGGAAYYFKIVKPRKQVAEQEEYEADFEDEEPGGDEYFFEEDGQDNE